ncbi:MAG: SOS response-associated peptidase family protein [Gammaproteobacteria bacterium]|nr:SOS response-associated peptidase family protein [Gammaproteobacteria bacterium]
MCANYEPIHLPNIAKLGMEQPSFNFDEEAFPYSKCPMIVSGDGADFAWQKAQFHLLPNWSKTKIYKAKTHNARLEKVDTLPSYRGAWRNNQFALIPMESFCEPCYETGKSEWWRIQRVDGEPFTVAAIYDEWTDHKETIQSFSMLTINAAKHPLMKRFHKPDEEKRSIVIIPPEHRLDWLHADHKTAMELIHELPTLEFKAAPKFITPKPLNLDFFFN